MLWNGSEAVEDLVRNQGFFTEKMLHVEASRVAQVHADHLAYSMAASTLGQARLSQMFPVPARPIGLLGLLQDRVDQRCCSGIEPRVAAGLKKVGLRNADRLIDMPLPLNLRLASRIADYAGTLTTLPQLEPSGQPTDIFQRLIDSYTFLPSRYDEGLWVQILPGMAPVPSWLLAWPARGRRRGAPPNP